MTYWTQEAQAYLAGPRSRLDSNLTVGAGATLEITNLIPTRAQLGAQTPFLILVIGQVVPLPIAGWVELQIEDESGIRVPFRLPTGPAVPNGALQIVAPIWPRDATTGFLTAYRPISRGGLVNFNRLFLVSTAQAPVDLWYTIEIPTQALGLEGLSQVSRWQQAAVEFGAAAPASIMVGALSGQTLAAGQNWDLTPEIPLRSELGNFGWVGLQVRTTLTQGLLPAFVSITQSAPPLTRTSYCPVGPIPTAGELAPWARPFDPPDLQITHLFPREPAGTLSDGSRLYLVNRDLVNGIVPSYLWFLPTLDWP